MLKGLVIPLQQGGPMKGLDWWSREAQGRSRGPSLVLCLTALVRLLLLLFICI